MCVNCIPFVVIVLTLLTTLDAAALNRTGQAASHVLPDDQLRPNDVEKDVHRSKDDVVSSLSRCTLLAVIDKCLVDI